MHKEFLMGNEAIALGALAAGVNLVAGYPGTPSTEVLETIAKRNPGNVYVEWSINEKAGMEVAAGAAYAGENAGYHEAGGTERGVGSADEPGIHRRKGRHGGARG